MNKLNLQLVGMGDNCRGPQVPPVPFPPNPGDGDNFRGAARPESIPAGMYLTIPPIGWSDSGIPGLFANNQDPMYPIKPLVIPSVQLDLRLAFGKDQNHLKAIKASSKIRLNQGFRQKDLRVHGSPYNFPMETITDARMVYVFCVAGLGSVSFDDGSLLLMEGRPLNQDQDGPEQEHSSFMFSNYPKGITKIVFSGNILVDVAVFQ